MKKKLILVLSLLIIGAILFNREAQIRVDESKIKHLNKYESASKSLLANLDRIEAIDRKNYQNKYEYGTPPFTILSAGEYYFKNTLTKDLNLDVSEVEHLWDKNLLEGRFHCVKMLSDSTVIFRVKQIDNFSSWVSHSLIYGQKGNIDKMLNTHSFNRVKRINDNWIYVSVRNYCLTAVERN